MAVAVVQMVVHFGVRERLGAHLNDDGLPSDAPLDRDCVAFPLFVAQPDVNVL
jgi:hypothetical protein